VNERRNPTRLLVTGFFREDDSGRAAARPIGTDQSDFFAGIQLKRSIHEEQLLAILLIDVCERDHFEGATRATPPPAV
jgi:hypothetical protein